jgi:hypothetical protein
MLAALWEGRRLDEVARSYGVTLQAFYQARRRDPVFAAAWRDAHALSAEAERRCSGSGPSTSLRTTAAAQPVPARGMPPACRSAYTPLPETSSGRNETHIVPNNRRVLQRRRMRHVRFDDRRKGIFLASFARNADAIAAAAAAGVCERTVYYHLRRDAEFAAAFQAALDEGYASLEAEAARERLEAQARLRAAQEQAEAGGDPLPPGAEGAEFDRTMKLLARWERRHGQLGLREVRPDRRRSMSFEAAILLLDKRLRNLGLRTDTPPAGREGAE